MAFTAWTAAWLVALGLGVGAFGTIVGAGGGFILTPILLLLYPHDSAKTITAISLVVVFFNAASGSIAYARQRRIDVRAGVVFALATLPGAVGGALLTVTVPSASAAASSTCRSSSGRSASRRTSRLRPRTSCWRSWRARDR